MEGNFNDYSHEEINEIIDCQFTSVIQEKENIKRELFYLSLREKEILENKNVFSKLIENYNVLKDKYQYTNEELNDFKIDNQCVDNIVQETQEKYIQLERKIKNSEEENRRLKDKTKYFELVISEKQCVLNDLKYYNYYQHLRLEKTVVKLNNYKNVIYTSVKQTGDIFQCFNNSEYRNVQKMYIQLNQYNMIKLKMISENRQLTVQCALIKYSNSEVEELLQSYKIQNQILLKEIDRSSVKLKQLISNLNSIDNTPIKNIEDYYDKCPELVELKYQNIEMIKNIDIYACKMIKIKDYNCKLTKIINYLNLKIEVLTKETNEKQNHFVEKIYKIGIENENLEAMLNLKNQTIKKLNMELSNITIMNKNKLKNVYMLKKKFYDLKSDQNNQIIFPNQCSNFKMSNTNVNIILNTFCTEYL